MEFISPTFSFLNDDAFSAPSVVNWGKNKEATSRQQAGTSRDHFIPLKIGFELEKNNFLFTDRLQREQSNLLQMPVFLTAIMTEMADYY